MILVFLLAGAVSVAATSLLARMRATSSDVTNDFAVQGAVAAAASGSQASSCASGYSTFPIPQVSSSPGTVGTCAGLSQAASGALTMMDLGSFDLRGCSATNLSTYQNNTALILFAARWAGTLSAMPSVNVLNVPDSTTDPCSATVGPSICSPKPQPGSNPVYPIALSCPKQAAPPSTHPVLIVRNALKQPKQFLFQSSTVSGTGMLYMTVAPTGLAAPADYEEALFFLPSKTAQQVQLLYEAPLP